MKLPAPLHIYMKGRLLFFAAAGLLALAYAAPLPAQAALVCPTKDPTGSIECVNPNTSWCGGTCAFEPGKGSNPACPTAPYTRSSFTAAQCGACACACPSGQTDCGTATYVCQDANAACPAANRASVCSGSGSQLVCGACLSGYMDCSGTCQATASPSCPAPAVYDPCTGACTHPYIQNNPPTTQTANIDISGDTKLGGDLYVTSGKAIRVDSASAATTLNLGNWGGFAAPNFTAAVKGKLETEGTLQLGLNSPPSVGNGQNLIYGNMQVGSTGNLLQLQVGGVTKFEIDKDGVITVGSIPTSAVANGIPISKLELSSVPAQIIVTDATKTPAYVTMSGDATIDTAGGLHLRPDPTFAKSVTTPVVVSAGPLTLQTTATASADDIVFTTTGNTQLQVYESGGVGFGNGSLVLGASGNLVYGNISGSSAVGSNLLLLQTGGVNKFAVDRTGALVTGTVPWANLTNVPTITSCTGSTDFVKSFNGTVFSCGTALWPAVGAANQTLRHNGAQWVAASNLVNTGTNVGINTTAPTQALEVREIIQTSTGTATSWTGIQSRNDQGVTFGLSVGGSGSTTGPTVFGLPRNGLVALTDVNSGATAPSAVAFGATTNTSVVFGTNNSERMRISPSGVVGIGTAAPVAADNGGLPIKLDVRGGLSLGNNASLSFLKSDGSGPYPVVRVTSGNRVDFCDPSGAWGGCVFSVNGASLGAMNSTGFQIGNGSTGPTYPLEAFVTGAPGAVGDAMRIGNLAGPANGTGAEMLFAANDSTAVMRNMAAVAGVVTDTTAATYKGALVFSTANNATLAERARIDSDGDLGLGTTNPTSRLHLYMNNVSTNAELDIQSGNGGTVQPKWAIYQDGTSGTGELRFWNNNVLSNGKHGLILKADAVGTVQVNTIQIMNGAGTSDYVLTSTNASGSGQWKPAGAVSDSCFGPKYAGKTVTSYDGSMGGYTVASDRCSAAIAGTHICTPEQLLRTFECARQNPGTYAGKFGLPLPPTDGSSGWISNGSPGATSPSVNDCMGFTSNSALIYGNLWTFNAGNDGWGSSTSCTSVIPIVCCK